MEELKDPETQGEKDAWANWKRGSMIGAAALTGGTIFAVTGGKMFVNSRISL